MPARPRTFTNGCSAALTAALVGAFSLGAGLAWYELGSAAGTVVTIAGLTLIAGLGAFTTRITIECQDHEVIVRTSRMFGGIRERRATWMAIEATRYRERTIDSGGHDATVGSFVVDARGGRLLELGSHARDFEAVIDCFNDRTPHLRYRWIPTRRTANLSVIETVGAWSRVAR